MCPLFILALFFAPPGTAFWIIGNCCAKDITRGLKWNTLVPIVVANSIKAITVIVFGYPIARR